MSLYHLECWPEISWCCVCTFQHSAVEIRHIPFLMLGLISDSWLTEALSFPNTNTSNTLIFKYFSHFHGCCYCGLCSVLWSRDIPITSPWLTAALWPRVQTSISGPEKRIRVPHHGDTFQLLGVLVSTTTGAVFLSHFLSSKRRGQNPTGIYGSSYRGLHRPSTDFSKLGSNLIAPTSLPVFLDFAR